MARHGLRVSELIDIRLGDLFLEETRTARLNINRLKGSLSGEHPIQGDELRALKAWLAIRPERSGFDNVFLTERGEHFSRQGINYLFRQIAIRAKMPHVNLDFPRKSGGLF